MSAPASSDLPTSMHAIRIHTTGGPSVLQYDTVSLPTIKDNQLLIQVGYAGVNYIDTYFRTGLYTVPFPNVLGREGAGIIVARGSAASVSHPSLAVGTRVVFFSPSAYAEYVAIDVSTAYPIPASIPLSIATAAYMQGLTAHYLATTTYPIQSGDWVLIHAAAGGVGQLLVQIAKLKGANIIATVGSATKAEIVKLLGAQHVINYSEEKEWYTKVRELTSGKGVRAAYDGVGLATYSQSLKSLGRLGYLILFGNASGAVPPIDPLLLSNNGSLYLSRPTLKDYIAEESELRRRSKELFEWIESGKVKVGVGKEVGLEEAGKAHELLESRAIAGKILLKVKGE